MQFLLKDLSQQKLGLDFSSFWHFVPDYSYFSWPVFPTEWSVRQACLTGEAMIPKLQVTLSFAFCFLPQGKLYHLSVIKLWALTVWVVVNTSERHNRQDMFTKLTLILWCLKFSHFAPGNYHLENTQPCLLLVPECWLTNGFKDQPPLRTQKLLKRLELVIRDERRYILHI